MEGPSSKLDLVYLLNSFGEPSLWIHAARKASLVLFYYYSWKYVKWCFNYSQVTKTSAQILSRGSRSSISEKILYIFFDFINRKYLYWYNHAIDNEIYNHKLLSILVKCTGKFCHWHKHIENRKVLIKKCLNRISHPELFWKRGALKIFTKFQAVVNLLVDRDRI